MLIILGGLPGSGKTTVARALAGQIGAVHLRIDTIETAMVNSGITLRGPEGYEAAYALAADFLRQGHTVIADSVNPWPLTRQAWLAVGEKAGVRTLSVQIICGVAAEHRRRVEAREPDLPGQRLPGWGDVVGRDVRPWPEADLVVDTSEQSVDEAVTLILRA